MDARTMIEAALESQGVTAAEWRDGEDGIEAVLKGTWGVVENDDDRGLYAGDEGTVTACVVGSEENHNQRVHFGFEPEGYEGGTEVRLFEDVEPL